MPSKYLCIFVSVWEGVGVVAAWRRGWIIEWESKFPHVSLLVGWSGGPPPGKFWKPRMQEKPSGHFAMRLKSQIYLNYDYLQIFQRRKSPFIPCCLNVFEAGRASSVGCAYRLISRWSRVQYSRPTHSFVEICMDMKKNSTTIVSLPLIQEGQLSVTGERMCTMNW